jgi:hypothetical protein
MQVGTTRLGKEGADTDEGNTRPLTPSAFDQEVLILCEEHPSQLTRAVKQRWICQTLSTILLRGENIHATHADSLGDRGWHVVIRVERHTHGSLPRSRILLIKGDSAFAFARSSSYSSRCRSISPSISCL